MEGGGISKGNNQMQQGARVVLSLKSQNVGHIQPRTDGDVAYFRIARDKKIQSLLLSYCKEKNMHYNDVTFVHNGTRVKATRTPNELGLEDGDEIDAMVYQNGGGYAGNILNIKCP